MWNKTILKALKKQKTGFRLVSFGLAVIIILSTFVLIAQDSYLNAKRDILYQKYGAWVGAISSNTNEITTLLEKEPNINEIGYIDLLSLNKVRTSKGTINLGYISDSMIQLGRIDLLEGDLPVESNEIVIEEFLIDVLGGNLKVGDPINLNIETLEGVESRAFRISGIVGNWGDDWVVGKSQLPDILLSSNNELLANELKRYTYFNVTNYEEAVLDDVLTMMDAENIVYTYNSSAYAYATGSADRYFENSTVFVILSIFNTVIIIYLLIATYNKRKYRCNILRTIGAEKSQIFQLIMSETSHQLIRTIICCIPLVFGLIVIKYVKIEIAGFTITANILSILIIIGITMIIFVLANIFSYFMINEDSISSSFKSENIHTYKRKFPKIGEVKKISLLKLSLRNKMFYRKETFTRIFMCLLAMVLVLFIGIDFLNGIKRYNLEKDNIQFEYNIEIMDLQDGLTVDQISQLREIEGITNTEQEKRITTYNGDITIASSAWLDSEYINTIRINTPTIDPTISSIEKADFYNKDLLKGIEDESTTSFLTMIEKNTGIDMNQEQFIKGKSCILMLTPFTLEDSEFVDWDYDVTPLKNEVVDENEKIFYYNQESDYVVVGDMIKINTSYGTIDLQVAAIISEGKDEYLEFMDEQPGSIAISEAAFDGFLADSEVDKYNYIKMYTHPEANFAEMDWQIENILQEYLGNESEPFYLDNRRMTYEIITNMVMVGIIRSGVLGILLVIALLWIIYISTFMQVARENTRIKCLRSIGMSKKKIYAMYLWENVIEGVVLAVIAGFITVFIQAIILQPYVGRLQLDIWNSKSSLFPIFVNVPWILAIVLSVFILLNLIFLGIALKKNMDK